MGARSLSHWATRVMGVCVYIYIYVYSLHVYVNICIFISLCQSQLQHVGSQLQHVRSSSLTRDRTPVPCIGIMGSQPLDYQRSSTESSLEVFVVLVFFFFFASSSKCWASQVVQLVKSLPANAGDAASVPGLGRFPREESGNPLQYSYLGSPMDRGACQATVHGVSKESDMTE